MKQIILLLKLLSFVKECMQNRLKIYCTKRQYIQSCFQASRSRVYKCRCASSFVIEKFTKFEYDQIVLILNKKNHYLQKCFTKQNHNHQDMNWILNQADKTKAYSTLNWTYILSHSTNYQAKWRQWISRK
jgi:hypothetical protein